MQSPTPSAGSTDAPPFKGTGAFGIDDAALFCGRRRAVDAALDQLLRNREAGCAFLLVHGGEGGGKSSFVHAGVAPRMLAPGFLPTAGKWRSAEVSGGAEAVESLARAIRRAVPELGKLRDRWNAVRLAKSLADPAELELAVSAVVAALDRISAAKPAQLLVLADPLADNDGAFLRAVTGLARTRRVWVVATLPSERLPWFAGHADLCPALRHGGSFFLPPPDAGELREMIEGPAAVAGLEFETHSETGRDLANAIHLAALAEDGRRILPRLQGALTTLYDQRLCNMLMWEAWDRLGGLAEIPDSDATAKPARVRVGRRVYLAAAAAVALLAVVLAAASRDARKTPPATQLAPAPQPEVAAARLELAAAHAMTGFPADSLPLLVAALESDPGNTGARDLLLDVLTRIEWHLPVAEVRPPLPIRSIAFGATTDDLLIASEAESPENPHNTAIVHHLADSAVTGVLAPTHGDAMHVLSVSPNSGRVLVRRGATLPTTTLLCDAKTLRVIAKLPAWQGRAMPGNCFAWSADGLLLAYPAAGPDSTLLWRICDAASGQTVRESAPFPPDGPEWLAVHLKRDRLRAVTAGGGVLDLPLAPDKPILTGQAGQRFTEAAFTTDGNRLKARLADGREPARRTVFSIAPDPEEDLLQIEVTTDPGPPDDTAPETWQAGGQFHFGDPTRAPIPATAEVTHASVSGDRVALASAGRGIVVHEFLLRLTRATGGIGKRPLAAAEIAALRNLAEALGGKTLAADDDLTVGERKEAAARVDQSALASLLAQEELAAVLDAFAARSAVTSTPADFEPLWDRLARAADADHLLIAARASAMGADHPWFRLYVRWLIGDWDAKLYAGRATGDFPPDLHRFAGDSSERAALKDAAWRAHATGDADAAELVAIHVAATAAAYDAAPTADAAFAHAESLAMAGDVAAAAELLDDELAADADISLEQAHFLVAAGLAEEFGGHLGDALVRHKSPWLGLAWLEAVAGTGVELAPAVELVMDLSEGRGPAAVGALRLGLRHQDAAAISIVLEHGREIPAHLKNYAAAVVLWTQSRQTEVFAMYPDGFPDLKSLAEAADWDGWEQALVWREVSDFFASVASGLSPLDPGPEATIDEWRALAMRLLDPETAEAFGSKRVRDAMVETALALTADADSSELVMLLVDTALLAGADPLPCLRAEARALMNQGLFTAAYARWLRLLEAPADALIADDFIEAAHCLFEDEQDAPALVLLNRGSGQYPADSAFALNAAWLALSTGHVTDADILLERGFRVGFPADQRETATALRVAIAERNGQPDLADAFFANLLALSDAWSASAMLDDLGWPELIREPIAAAQERHAAENEE